MNIQITNTIVLLYLISIKIYSQPNEDFQLIKYNTRDGGTIEGAYFKGGDDLVVIFAHGAVFNKESWYFLNRRLQRQKISSLSIDFRGYGNSKKGDSGNLSYDLLGAVDYLKGKGFSRIAMVGGSMGGTAVITAIETKMDPTIKKVVLLAPAGGKGIKSESIEKLFIVSEKEGMVTRVKQIYDQSSDPKKIKIFPGSAHAQHMFKEQYAEELIQTMIDFLIN